MVAFPALKAHHGRGRSAVFASILARVEMERGPAAKCRMAVWFCARYCALGNPKLKSRKKVALTMVWCVQMVE